MKKRLIIFVFATILIFTSLTSAVDSSCSSEGDCVIVLNKLGMGGVKEWINPGIYYSVGVDILRSSKVLFSIGGTTINPGSVKTESFSLNEGESITLSDGSIFTFEKFFPNETVSFKIKTNVERESYCYSKKKKDCPKCDSRVSSIQKVCRLYLGGGPITIDLDGKIYESYLETISDQEGFTLNINGESMGRGSNFENIRITGPVMTDMGILFAEVTFKYTLPSDATFWEKVGYWFKRFI